MGGWRVHLDYKKNWKVFLKIFPPVKTLQYSAFHLMHWQCMYCASIFCFCLWVGEVTHILTKIGLFEFCIYTKPLTWTKPNWTDITSLQESCLQRWHGCRDSRNSICVTMFHVGATNWQHQHRSRHLVGFTCYRNKLTRYEQRWWASSIEGIALV